MTFDEVEGFICTSPSDPLTLQHDHVNFDRFVKFALFIQNLEYFLFRYSWIEHHLLYRTI